LLTSCVIELLPILLGTADRRVVPFARRIPVISYEVYGGTERVDGSI
jgi:hypothetical protein